MTTPSSHDLIQLSAYLDGELQPAEKARLEQRLATDANLRAALEDLRQTRFLLRQVPSRRPPRNFTLTPRTQNVRPPLPRLTPALSWASLVILLAFFVALGSNVLAGLGAAAPAPLAAAQPLTTPEQEGAPLLAMGGEAFPTATPAETPTAPLAMNPPSPEMRAFVVQEAEAVPEAGFSAWWMIAPAVALLLFATAWGVRWVQLRAFRKRYLEK